MFPKRSEPAPIWWARLLPLLALLACLLSLQTQASADGFSTICNSFASVQVSPNSSPVFASQSGSSSCLSTASDSATDTIIPQEGDIAQFTQTGSGTAGGSASPGHISVSATGTASSTPQSYIFLDAEGHPFAVDNNEQAAAGGEVQADWTDFFTVVGPPQTNVTLQFTESFDITTAFTAPSFASGFDQLFVGGNEPLSLGTCNVCEPAPGTETGDFTFPAGSTFAVIDAAGVSASACAGGPASPPIGCGTGSYIASGTATANASQTALVFVTDLTPGTSFSTASGFNYAATSPVPEPSSLLLLGAGLLAVSPLLRRRILAPGRRSINQG